jgi:hypothetical protein
LIIRSVAILNAQIERVHFNVDMRHDELLLDEVPNDARHFVAVHLDHGTGCNTRLHMFGHGRHLHLIFVIFINGNAFDLV